jgi:flagellar motor switch protein FliG
MPAPLPTVPTAPTAEQIAAATAALPRDTTITGVRKAAITLIALGTEAASLVLKNMRDDEVERITVEIAKARNVSSEVVEKTLMEFRDMSMARDYIAQGGVNFARQALESALGPRRADEIMMRVEAAMEVSAFHLLQTVETAQLTNFLMNEHPQTAALILAHLNPRKAADIVSGVAPELQQEILYRLATMGKTSPELLRDIEDVIRQQIGSVIGTELSATGGIETVAEILNNTSRAAEKSIMEGIKDRNPELAANIKSLMFVFDDLIHVSDRELQRLLMEVDQKELALALKATSDDLKNKLLRNVSERAAAMISEEIDLMGPVRVRDVEEAQRRIIETAQSLEDQDEIVLSRSSEDALLG